MWNVPVGGSFIKYFYKSLKNKKKETYFIWQQNWIFSNCCNWLSLEKNMSQYMQFLVELPTICSHAKENTWELGGGGLNLYLQLIMHMGFCFIF